MNQRIIGFDLARAYAIFGMYIVNFTFCFGSFRNETILGKFTNLFIGNSTSIFIVCAGMGMVFLANRYNNSKEEKRKLHLIVLKRSLFLVALGLMLYNCWPGDILHFYGAYMHVAAFILFVPKKYYIWAAVIVLVVYHILQFFIPVTTGWNLETTAYFDFWTPIGFLRNTCYNGWNSFFPWFAYFALGMYLGKVDWQNKRTWKKLFTIGLCLLVVFKGLRLFISYDLENPEHNWFYIKYWFQLMEDYFPVNIPFFMITLGWALMIISTCMFLGNRFAQNKLIQLLAKTGEMTLTHYVFHMTVGVMIFALLTAKKYTGFPQVEMPVEPVYILLYALAFFGLSVAFSALWSKRFKNGPLEMLMRFISDKSFISKIKKHV